MKKAFKFMVVATVLVFATSSSLMAQVKFGVKASGTMNNMFLDSDTIKDIKRSPVFGFNVGVMGEYFLNDNMSVGAELLFAQQGYKRTIETGDENNGFKSETTYRTNHINLPILFRYYIGGLAIEAGPQVSFCFGGKIKGHSEETILGHTATQDTTISLGDVEADYQKGMSDFKLWNRINIGGTIGLSYNMASGLFFGARYTYDFTNAFNDMKLGDDLKPKQEASKSHHSVISVSVGFKF
ncbi:MAG: PorT family protein [Bacteroidales bacterium]|nr:PorT family protein [Bacteroidales bacterium]